HAALRELPAVALHAPRPEHLATRVQQHDAHIQAIAVHVDHGPDSSTAREPSASPRRPRGRERRRIFVVVFVVRVAPAVVAGYKRRTVFADKHGFDDLPPLAGPVPRPPEIPAAL